MWQTLSAENSSVQSPDPWYARLRKRDYQYGTQSDDLITTSHTYTSPNVYNARITVYNDLSSVTNETTVAVLVPITYLAIGLSHNSKFDMGQCLLRDSRSGWCLASPSTPLDPDSNPTRGTVWIGFSVPNRLRVFSLEEFSWVFLPHLKLILLHCLLSYCLVVVENIENISTSKSKLKISYLSAMKTMGAFD